MANQIVVSAGAKVRNLDGVLTGTSGVVNSLPINASNGIPQLDVNGKILVSQLPNSVMEYQGVWNANTNTPTLTNGGAFNQGDVYLCNVAGTTNFGAGPISFIVGDQAIYSGTIWQKAGGATGTVTSVGITESGDSLNITGSPITTSGTINIGFNGTNLQYVNGAGNLTTFPTLITSIGLSMPSAFSVANSPLTANGTIAVTGAGTTAQYIRGDGSLATFPTIATEAQRLITEVYNETGATLTKGTVVYINGGHGNLPTITKAIATGDATSAQTYGVVQNDITDNNNGYVVVLGSLTDLDTQAYANGTQLYLSSTVAGAWTSVKQYAPAHLVYVAIVTRSHPTQGVVEVRIQNGFEMDELHNVSAQSPLNNQGLFYNTSTSLWENKSIATALGYTPADDSLVVKLAGSQTITGVKNFNIGLTLQDGYYPTPATGYVGLGSNGSGITILTKSGVTVYNNNLQFSNASNSYYFPNATGTIALTSDIPSLAGYVTLATTQTITGAKTFSGAVTLTSSVTTNNLTFANSGFFLTLQPPTLSVNRTVTLPDASGTLALTSNLSAYVPYTGATGNVDLGSNSITLFNITSNNVLIVKNTGSVTGTNGFSSFSGNLANNGFTFAPNNSSYHRFIVPTSSNYDYTLPSSSGTIALTSDISYPVTSVFGRTGAVVATSGDYTTAQVTESGNLYFTDSRARLALSAGVGISYNNTTGVITNSAPDQTVSLTAGAGISVSGTYPSFTIASTITQYTDALARAAISLTTTGTSGAATYNSTTGVLNIPQYIGGVTSVFGRTGAVVATEGDYSLTQLSDVTITSPTTNQVLKYNGTTWVNDTDANTGTVTSVGLSSATSGVTIGSSPVTTSGTITLAIATATTSQNGLLSSTDFTTFNNKANALSGTINTIAYWDSTTTIASLALATYPSLTELSYVKGVTSAIQTQLNAKQGTLTLTTTGTSGAATLVGNTLNIPQYSGGGSSYTFTAPLSETSGVVSITDASASVSGVVTTGTQTFAGVKTFSPSVTASGAVARGTILSPTLVAAANNDVLSAVYINPTFTNGAFTGVKNYALNVVGSAYYSGNISFGNNANNILSASNMQIVDTAANKYFQFSVTSTVANIQTNYTDSNIPLTLNSYGNANQLYLAIGGSIGIGTSTIGSKLQVNGNAAIGYSASTAAPTNGLAVSGSVFIGTSDDGGKLVSYSTTAATQIKAAGTAPAITFSNTVLSPTIGGVLGVCTAASQFFTGTASSDMVLANQFSAGSLIFGTNNTERMRISSTGNVDIGGGNRNIWDLEITQNSSAGGAGGYPAVVVNNSDAAGYSAFYHFQGSTNKGGLEYSNAANQLLITTGGTYKLSALGTGTVTATAGVLSVVSDMNLKIEDGYIENALDKVLKLIPRYFYWKKETGLPTDLRQLGFYAQEVNLALGEETANTPKNENDKWGIYDRGMIAMLTKALQEQQLQIEELKLKIK